jgi:vacuolar-type H+-ATPase subunit E/Vma4
MGKQTLDTLIDKIKSEAIEAAEHKATEILDRARMEAQNITTEAEAKREALLFGADKEAQATLAKGEIALKQAARDLIISVRNDLLELLKKLLEQEVEDNFTPDLMEKAILIIMENMGSGTELRLSEDMESELAEKVRRRLQQSDTSNSISMDSALPKGFSVAKTEEGWSYHISSKELADLLNDHLSPKWVEILEKE